MENKNMTKPLEILIVEDSFEINPLSGINQISELKQYLEKSVKNYEDDHLSELTKYEINPKDFVELVSEYMNKALSEGNSNGHIESSHYLLKNHLKNNPLSSLLDCFSMPLYDHIIRHIFHYSLEEKYRNKEITDYNRKISEEEDNIDTTGLSFNDQIELRREISKKKKKDEKFEAVVSYLKNLQEYISGYTKEKVLHKTVCSILENPVLNMDVRESCEDILSSTFENALIESGVNANVDFTVDAEKALEYLNSKNYDFAITDVGIPLIDEKTNKKIPKSLKQKYQKVFNEQRKQEISREVDIPERDYLEHELKVDFDPYYAAFYSGNLVTLLARQKNIPTLQYTDNGHFDRSIISSLVAKNLSPEDFYKLIKGIDEQKTYNLKIRVGNFQIGEKSMENYFKVVSDFVKEK